MRAKSENCTLFLGGALIGGAVGALAGILFAPKSGQELRSDLKKGGEEALGEAKRLYSETQARARHIVDDALHQAEALTREADHKISGVYKKARGMVCSGEESVISEYADEPRGDA